MGAKTERERDYLEAVAAYYAGLRQPLGARAAGQRARRRTKRSRRSTRDDDEAQIF